jgi:hypothetical protein
MLLVVTLAVVENEAEVPEKEVKLMEPANGVAERVRTSRFGKELNGTSVDFNLIFFSSLILVF